MAVWLYISMGFREQMQHTTPEARLMKKEEAMPLKELAIRFDAQAEQAMANIVLVESIRVRLSDINAGTSEQQEHICGQIARQNPKALPDTIESDKQKAAYVLAVANKIIEQRGAAN